MKRLAHALLTCFLVVGLAACGGGGGGAPSAVTGQASNEQAIYVDAGPFGTGYNANRLYTDVTICQPGSSVNCQVIQQVLVDSGSTGLRLLATDLNPSLGLVKASAAGQTLVNCARFVDGSFGWGSVATADIKLGGLVAPGVRIHLMGDPSFASSSGLCSSGSAIQTAASIGARGILGIGLFKEDCGAACAAAAVPKFYYACAPGGACVNVPLAAANQVRNPVPLLPSDNNGVLFDLPAVGSQPAVSTTGKMVFGIGTRTNNSLDAAKIFRTDSQGYVTTILGGKVMTQSFLDTGSNGLYFDNSAATGITGLNTCSGTGGALSFYCPAGSLNLNATITSSSATAVVPFLVDNAANSFTGTPSVLPGLAGTFGNTSTFDWGLPFFYGRKVFFAVEGMASPGGTGPYYAF
jgi:hypothetical protein